MSVKLAALAAMTTLASLAPSAFAEPGIDSGQPRRRVQIAGQAHFGVATTPFPVSTLRRAKGQAFVFAAAAGYDVSSRVALELGVPWVLGSVARPAGSYVDTAALGAPQLGARYELVRRRSRTSALDVDAGLSVGLPFASHADDLMPNRVLAIADGIEGRGQPEWFTPGALPITARATVRWTARGWSVDGTLKLPLLVRVSEADLPSATTSTHRVGLAMVASTEVRYGLSRRYSLALAEQLFFDVAPLASHVGDVSPVQDVERLSLQVRLGSTGSLIVDLQTAIGGDLSGSMLGGGLRTIIAW
jgi:hypothetical protein